MHFYKKMNAKNFHLVSGAGIRTKDLLNMSPLP